jgi:hypothetical protein
MQKLTFVLCRERPLALKVFRGATNLERDAGQGVEHPLLDKPDCTARDVDIRPIVAKALRRISFRATAAERVA